jgi:hypothetical protein
MKEGLRSVGRGLRERKKGSKKLGRVKVRRKVKKSGR